MTQKTDEALFALWLRISVATGLIACRVKNGVEIGKDADSMKMSKNFVLRNVGRSCRIPAVDRYRHYNYGYGYRCSYEKSRSKSHSPV